MTEQELLTVRDLSLVFQTEQGLVHALDEVSLDISEGEVVGLVGESGAGKSVLGLSIIGLIPVPPGKIESGSIIYQGQDLTKFSRKEMVKIRGTGISMIFQEPMTSLNPVFKVGNQIEESIQLRKKRMNNLNPNEKPGESTMNEVIQALKLVRIPDPENVLGRYPHELSGGMRQRVMIAMALAAKPSLLIADEPTTALDVTTQARILALMRELIKKVKTSILFISHDFGVIAQIADRVAVMYAGNIVEVALTKNILKEPLHPYTKGLLQCLPSISKGEAALEPLPGTIPNLINPPSGCKFHPRCPYAMPICAKQKPGFMLPQPTRRVACFLFGGEA